MKLYNTLSKHVDELKPLDEKVMRMYSCGPTVYDHVHIGNLSSFIFADTLRRVLVGTGHGVKHVMNFTDVDDKTIRRSLENYGHLGPMEALLKLTAEYSDAFLEDMKSVGNDVNSVTFVKATDSIEDMQKLIRELHKDGFAYIADDGVYFSIEAYKKSGKVYGQLTEITTSSTGEARIQNDEYDKESIHDFALWKKQKESEPAWDFKLDGKTLDGRPGWHIECSAMSRALLGQPFDIHTGGVDLIFPHHENEIAQSTAGNENPTLASFFVHNEHLLIDDQKMSKSLNNFYTLEDIKAKGFDPLALRLLILQSHYRSQAHFTWENLTAAQNRLKTFRELAALRWQLAPITHDASIFALDDVAVELARLLSEDLNTPQALSYLSYVSTQLQTVLVSSDEEGHFVTMLQSIDALLGLNLMSESDISAEQKQLIDEREKARHGQDWQRSDELRTELEKQGIGLRDKADRAIWFRS